MGLILLLHTMKFYSLLIFSFRQVLRLLILMPIFQMGSNCNKNLGSGQQSDVEESVLHKESTIKTENNDTKIKNEPPVSAKHLDKSQENKDENSVNHLEGDGPPSKEKENKTYSFSGDKLFEFEPKISLSQIKNVYKKSPEAFMARLNALYELDWFINSYKERNFVRGDIAYESLKKIKIDSRSIKEATIEDLINFDELEAYKKAFIENEISEVTEWGENPNNKPTAILLGYCGVGKTSIFNMLCKTTRSVDDHEGDPGKKVIFLAMLSVVMIMSFH